VEQSKTLNTNQKKEEKLQHLCESFIKGQETIYVLGKGNKQGTANGIVDNDPQ